ncbi:MAG TPA: succinate dehydrogenase iron-sulfur subunit [Phycisphaerae bacterium]|nr:succinate dehydrogenase iron-sulfur subunit [Phycisphaerae bacterium]
MARHVLRVFRYDPEKDGKGYEQRFEVEAESHWTVLDALHEIKWHQDGTLSFRRSCRHGICGSCAMTINGKNGLACELQLAALGSEIVVEPLRGLPVIRDLVVDMQPIYDAMVAVKPYLITGSSPMSDQERLQSPEERARLDGLYECILCGSCTSSCPSFWADKQYLGPHALLWAWRYIADSRDEGEADRVGVLDDKHGLWRCHKIFNCVECCPKDLNPTKAISSLQRAVISGRF